MRDGEIMLGHVTLESRSFLPGRGPWVGGHVPGTGSVRVMARGPLTAQTHTPSMPKHKGGAGV